MFADLLRQARSFRRFDQTDPIPPQVLTDLVDLARLVPSGANAQPLRYRIVSDEAERAAVFPHTAWAGALRDWPGPAEGERPTGYIAICSAAGKPEPATDIGIAGQTIQLAATDLGYGACMLGAIERDMLHAALKLPEDLALRLLLALGRPAETVVLEDLAPGASTAYWRDSDGVHHVPKRTLDEVLLRP
jgi:nitroreductase